MNSSRIFETINRINSMVFLLLLIGGVVLLVQALVSVGHWQDKRVVKVVPDDAGEDEKKIELVFGGIQSVTNDSKYILLSTKGEGAKFSSGSSSGDIRNVLFFRAGDLGQHWLFENHSHLIEYVRTLSKTDARNNETSVAILYELKHSDTNKDGVIDSDDLSTLALTDIYGNNYTEIEGGVQSVLDWDVVDNGKFLVMLLKNGNKVTLKKYSISGFNLITKKAVRDI